MKEQPLRIKWKILATLTVAATVIAPLSTDASASISLKALEGDLLSPAKVRPLGFTKVLEKARTSSATGQKSCPEGAEQVFEDESGQTGLASEVLACTNIQAARGLLIRLRSQGSAVSVVLPKRLGPSAIERNIGRSTFAIYWQRGKIVEVVAMTTNLVAATSSSTSTSAVSSPLTSVEQRNLSAAALQQNGLLR